MMFKFNFFKICIMLVFTFIFTLTIVSSAFGQLSESTINIKWYAHSCFSIENKNTSIVTDPYDPSTGYTMPVMTPDIVTTSHNHSDHNYVDAFKNNFKLINTTDTFTKRNISIKGIASFHDKTNGSERGLNTIYTYKINKIKICHLGDLGDLLSTEQIKEIGKVDVLMIPVGGYYTIDAVEAIKVVNQLNPKVVIPMHYKTPQASSTFANLTDNKPFLDGMANWQIKNLKELNINNHNLKFELSHTVINLKY